MTRAVVIGERGPLRERVAAALAGTPDIELAGGLDLGRPCAERIEQMEPDLTVILEPASRPVPAAVIREVRHAAPRAALIVAAADATPRWVADAINSGATAVLPSTVDVGSLGRVALHIVTEHDPAFESLRLRWAA